MSIEKLKLATGDLMETLSTVGEFADMDSHELEHTFGDIAAIILILEEQPELGHLCLGRDLEYNLISLKTAAIVIHKTVPLKENVEEMLGATDWYEIQEIVDKLYDALEEDDQK